MRVAYFLPAPFCGSQNIWGKTIAQMEELQRLGVEVSLFSFRGKEKCQAVPHDEVDLRGTGTLCKQIPLVELVRKVLGMKPDLVYLRRGFWHPVYSLLMGRIPTVAEVNTDETAEATVRCSRWRRMYEGMTRNCWDRYTAGYVCMTAELAGKVQCQKAAAVISNGILHSRGSNFPGRKGGRPHLAFSGTGGYSWHGADKLVKLARAFPDWQFTFIGSFPAEVGSDLVPSNLRIVNSLSKPEADALLGRVDVGVGTLALHRKRMEEACPLKVRSYLGAGLPCILPYLDTDFSHSQNWFTLSIPNRWDNVESHREQIRDFVEQVCGRRVSWKEVAFASESEKAIQRLGFFQQVLQLRSF